MSNTMELSQGQMAPGDLVDGRYRVEARLNNGSYGEVFLATDVETDQRFAVKRLAKPGAPAGLTPQAIDERSEEVLCHESLGSHPTIVNLIRHFETDTHVYLVLEFCSNGDLFEAIQLEKGPLKTEHVRAFMLQLVDAVEYMHARGFYHRDIKPENIFLTEDGDAKLGDFGLVTRDEWCYEVAVGSERYMAPEQYDPGEGGYSPAKVDIWAVGICLLNVLFASNPFKVPQESDTLFADYHRDPQSLFDLFPKMTLDTFDVLVHALAIDPAKRSLSAVRESLKRVVSFTTDDETVDDFCTETREIVPVPSRREPLRTPSIKSPYVGPGVAFPWAKVLHTSPQPAIRPLSIVTDLTVGSSENDVSDQGASVEDGIPETPDTPSVFHLGDSGLGSSLLSLEVRKAEAEQRNRATVKPVPVPAAATKSVPLPESVFGKMADSVSKSWYDIWDEEAEESAEEERRQQTTRQSEPSPPDHSHHMQRYRVVSRSHDNLKASRVASKMEKHWRASGRPGKIAPAAGFDGVDERDDFFHVQHPSRSSAPKYRPSPSRPDIMDRWAALGRRRRAFNIVKNAPAPSGSAAARGLSGDVDGVEGRLGAVGVWGRNGVARDVSGPDHASDDLGDLEWVGGWHDFHLDC